MVFLRIRRRTWLSYSHIWLGRFVMLAAYSNLISGMLLREYSSFFVLLMGIASLAVVLALVVKLWRVGRAAGRSGVKQSFAMKAAGQGAEENYFALDEDEDDDEIGEEEEDEDDDNDTVASAAVRK